MPTQSFEKNFDIKAALILLRPHQWVKNLLLFVSLFASHQLANVDYLIATFVGFIAFCLVASGTYIVNDILDLESDRQHPTKRERPLAASKVKIPHAVAIAAVLIIIGIGLGRFIGTEFFACLVGYLLLNFGYSLVFKTMLAIDVVVLSLLYIMRIVAGAAASETMPSFWLLAFSLFVFTSLAMLKRYAELEQQQLTGATNKRRAYRVEDKSVMAMMGAACGLISVFVFAFYLNSKDVTILYQRAEILWLVVPVLFCWIIRIWLLASRAMINEDPIVFALRDRFSYVSAVIMGLLIIVAT